MTNFMTVFQLIACLTRKNANKIKLQSMLSYGAIVVRH